MVKLLVAAADVEALRGAANAIVKALQRSGKRRAVMLLGAGKTLSAFAIVPNALQATLSAYTWVYETLAVAGWIRPNPLAGGTTGEGKPTGARAQGKASDPSKAAEAKAAANAYYAFKVLGEPLDVAISDEEAVRYLMERLSTEDRSKAFSSGDWKQMSWTQRRRRLADIGVPADDEAVVARMGPSMAKVKAERAKVIEAKAKNEAEEAKRVKAIEAKRAKAIEAKAKKEAEEGKPKEAEAPANDGKAAADA